MRPIVSTFRNRPRDRIKRRFEPSGQGTKVTIEFDFVTPGLPPGMLAPMGWAIAGKVRDVLAHDLADLKASSEHVRT